MGTVYRSGNNYIIFNNLTRVRLCQFPCFLDSGSAIAAMFLGAQRANGVPCPEGHETARLPE